MWEQYYLAHFCTFPGCGKEGEWRALHTNGRGSGERSICWGRNACARCQDLLCSKHLVTGPAARDSTDGFCWDCFGKVPHCTSCGLLGKDNVAVRHNEGSNRNQARPETLFRCSAACCNLLCSLCGTKFDGCQIHRNGPVLPSWEKELGAQELPWTVAGQLGNSDAPIRGGRQGNRAWDRNLFVGHRRR